MYRERSRSVIDPFADHMLSAPAADGSGAAYIERPRPQSEDSATFTIVIHRGGETSVRTFRYQPRPVTQFERDRRHQIIDSYVEQLGKIAGYPEREYRQVLGEALPLPEYSLPVLDAVMDPTGRVWLAVEEIDEGMLWVAVNELGYTGERLLIPSEEQLMDLGVDRVLTLQKDSFDVPSLTVYRIR